MLKIAVTGGIASGKSFLGDFLQKKGYKVIDTDIISKQLSQKGESGYKKIIEVFGKKVLDEKEEIDKKTLAKRVFNDKQSLQKLNAALHPLIIKELNRQIAACQTEKYIFVLVPLLFELNMQNEFDRVWLILSEKQIRINRAAQREGSYNHKTEQIIKNQINHADYAHYAHNVLYNNNSAEEFILQILEALKTL